MLPSLLLVYSCQVSHNRRQAELQSSAARHVIKPHSFGRHPSSDVSLEPKAATKCWHWNAMTRAAKGMGWQWLAVYLLDVDINHNASGIIFQLLWQYFKSVSLSLSLCPHLTSLSNLFILKPLLSLLSSILLASSEPWLSFFFAVFPSAPFLLCCWLALYLPVLCYYVYGHFSFTDSTNIHFFHHKSLAVSSCYYSVFISSDQSAEITELRVLRTHTDAVTPTRTPHTQTYLQLNCIFTCRSNKILWMPPDATRG